MSGVAAELTQMFPPRKPFFTTMGESDVPPALLDALVEYLEDFLGCDHDVGICTCGTAELVYQLKLAREGKRICPACGGEGAEWQGDGRPIPCPKCHTSGTVPIVEEDEE